MVSSLVDGLVFGGSVALQELPARSPRRAVASTGLLALQAVDVVAPELPAIRQAWRGRPVPPVADGDRLAVSRYTVVAGCWAALIGLGEKRASAALARRGTRRPHLVVGGAVGLAAAASTLPVWWQRASARIEEDETAAALDAELAELLAENAY